MKKRFFLIIFICMFFVTGCSKNKGENVNKVVHTVVSTEIQETVSDSDNAETEDVETEEDISGQELFGGQYNVDDVQNATLSDDINSYQIQIDDCVLEFPMPYSTLLLKGWNVNTLYGNDTSPLKCGEYTTVQFVRGELQFGFFIYNPDITIRKVKDCVIAGVEINMLDYTESDTIRLPNNIIIGTSSIEEVIDIMGEPDNTEVFESDNVKVDYIKYIENADIFKVDTDSRAEKRLTFKNGILVDVELSCFKANDGFEFSKGNPDIVPKYDEPTELTDSMADNIVCFKDELYRLPVPAYAFLNNGWEMRENYEKLDDGADTTIAGNDKIGVFLERDGFRFIAYLCNKNDEAILARNAMIYELGSTEEDSLSEVSGGICIGLDETELENILNNANIEYDKTIDTSEDGDKKSISTEFRIKNSSGYSMSYVKCEVGKVVAIKWVVEE